MDSWRILCSEPAIVGQKHEYGKAVPILLLEGQPEWIGQSRKAFWLDERCSNTDSSMKLQEEESAKESWKKKKRKQPIGYEWQ